eukprot:SAG11_NODE_1157_length_5657_cov_30.018712_2_plen_30_part_00
MSDINVIMCFVLARARRSAAGSGVVHSGP